MTFSSGCWGPSIKIQYCVPGCQIVQEYKCFGWQKYLHFPFGESPPKAWQPLLWTVDQPTDTQKLAVEEIKYSHDKANRARQSTPHWESVQSVAKLGHLWRQTNWQCNWGTVDQGYKLAILTITDSCFFVAATVSRWEYDTLSMSVCVCLTSSRGRLPSDVVSMARWLSPPNACKVIPPPGSAHQPLSGEMLDDGYLLGSVHGTATGLSVSVLPGMSLCDT